MNNFRVRQFYALIKREVLEHTTLFIYAPAILAVVILLGTAWLMSLAPDEQVALAIEYAAMLFDGLSPLEMAPLFMLLAIPFIIVLSICGLTYLLNTLFQDRKDSSVLFWQSMPVSNLRTVASKLTTVLAVAPLFYVAILFVLYLLSMTWLTILGISYDISVSGLGYMFMAAVVSLVLVYLSMVIAGLWLFPTVGWLLLFSAFSKRAPALSAIGVYMLLLFLEEFVFGTQFLVNWIESRSNPNQYVIFGFSDVLDRLFNYDMLFGLMVGAILVTGATLMRRFAD